MADSASVTCLADVKAVLGEGPVWVEREQALYWTDIRGRRIFRRGAGGELDEWATPFRIGSLAPRADGGFVAGAESGFAFIDPAAGSFGLQFDPEPERASNRFNDGKLDRAGRFWAGTMDDAETEASGALYRLSPGAGPVRVDDGYKVTNGPAFSPDGRLMYHNDSALQITYEFDLDADGGASNRRVFLRFGEGDGYPDGMTVDAEGCLWIAFWDGWCVRRFSPAGALLATIEMPVARPTSCTFGGPELDRLFVTSARIGLDDEALAGQPHAGGLFVLEPGVAGLADTPFAG
ncbi:MAG TPA: SMP-30/gluconolactonase/LRE family protein [Allosphingosinicella sp.]|nr:SMP-30/gluconolactonase/LRE family protein [Allosphingosinicella sp.]